MKSLNLFEILKKKKNLIFISSIIFLLFLFFFFTREKNINYDSTPVENTRDNNILISKINTQKFSRSLILRGYTESSRTVRLKSQVEGKISAVNFVKGENVKAGKFIVLIDPEDKIARSKEMEALLDQRKKEYEVAEKLFKSGFRSEVKLSESRTKFEEALTLYEQSQVALSNTKITIPFDSYIDESFVELGDYLKKGDNIVTVVDLDPIHLVATASEKEINFIKTGQKGLALFNNDLILEGKINFVSVSANKKTRNFIVQLEIPNSDKKILAGLSGEIQLNLDPEDAFFIPSSVITLNNKGEIGIKVVKKNKVIFKSISILSDTGDGYWITSNGELYLNLITRGQEYILDGDSINTDY